MSYQKAKKIILCIVCSYFFTQIAGFSDDQKQEAGVSLSLRQAITAVFKNNKAIQIQESEIKVAKAEVLAAKSAFLPNVSAVAGYTHNDAVLTVGNSASFKKDMGIFTGYKNDNQAGISAKQLVYNGNANLARLKQGQINLGLQEQTLRARKLDAEFESKRLYYGLLLAQETLRIAQDLYDQAQKHYEDVHHKYSQGMVSRFDELQSKVQVSKVLPELIKAKNAVTLIMAELNKLMGLDVHQKIITTDALVYDLIAIDEAEFLKLAYLNKPETLLKSFGVDIAKWQIQISRSEYRPQIEASSNYNYRSNDMLDMFNKRHNFWDVGVAVSVPIFDGFSSKAKVDQAKARYAQARLDKEDLTQQIAVDIRQACLDLAEAESIINSQKDNVGEAKEAVSIAQVSYDNGEATNLEVLDAQVSLSQIQKNLSEGIYDYLMAVAFLDRSMGRQIVEEGADNEKRN